MRVTTASVKDWIVEVVAYELAHTGNDDDEEEDE